MRQINQEEHNIFRESVGRFLDDEVTPYYDAWEETGIPREFWSKAGVAGLLCPMVPEAYGGPGGDYRFNAVILEEIARCGATGLVGLSVHNDVVVPYILAYGSEEQKQHWLPRMVTGEVFTSIGMSEPGGGSDLQAVRTSARLDGNHLERPFLRGGAARCQDRPRARRQGH